MSGAAAAAPGEVGVWIQVDDPVTAAMIDRVVEGSGGVLRDDNLPEGYAVSVLIVDEAHSDALARRGSQGDTAMQTILLSTDTSPGQADFVLPADVDEAVFRTVFTAAREFRDQVRSLQADVASRQSAVGTINHGQFVLRSLDEARNLATMLALACPNADLVAIGLQELLINAVEHGNLEISAEEKQALINEGRWRDEVEKRLKSPEYADRVVLVNFQRGERLIAITIQDDGAGFEYDSYIDADVPSEGYRGRGIAMARDISFSSIAYLGRGNVVEATILLERD